MVRRTLAVPGWVALLGVAMLLALPLATQAGDADVGVEWCNNFPDRASCDDLSHRDECAERFYDKLRDNGWIGRFCYGNNNAWERDFKDSDNGGWDQSYIDRCDIALVASHGNSNGVSLNSTVDDQRITNSDAIWGDDNDLEWIILDACGCLERGARLGWQPCFDRLHTICGFDTNAHDKSWRGKKMARKLLNSYTVVQAWWYASETTEGSGTYSATMGVYAPNDTWGDHIHGEGSVASDSDPWTATWYASHDCD